MDFKVRNSTDRDGIKAYLDRLPEGKEYDVRIVLHRNKRSDSQNNLYWMWLGIISKDTGNSAEDIHKVFARKFIGVDVVDFAGEKIAKVKSTTRLSTEDFTAYLGQVEAFALTELGIVLPHPEDLYYNQFED